jgi:enoyl-CoA hydratase/carnithine racemase
VSPDDAGMVRIEVRERIATLTLDRPDRLNAITIPMFAELMAALDRVDEDDDIRAAIVTGSGRAFCAGADVSGGPEGFTGGPRPAGGGERGNDPPAPQRDGGGVLVLRILACKKPVIAAVNGAAVGLGATMTLPMDFRLAATGARFGFVFGRRGIVPDGASSWFLPRVVGIGRALDWVETGRIFGSDEALTAGLVGGVHEPDALLDAAWEIAATIRDNVAPVSVAVSRQLLWRMTMAQDPMEAHRIESRLIAQRAASPDAFEGVRAFLDKRPPDFPMKVSTDLPEPYPWWEELPFA